MTRAVGSSLQVHHRSTAVDGIDVFYRESGPPDAPVLLLLHGFPTSSRMFRNLMPRLSEAYRLIAPDYPGFGHSGVPDRGGFRYTFDNLAEVVDKFLDRLHVGSFTPYVMDFGGPVGYRLALKYPERISAIVMQNAPLYPEAPEGWWETLGKYWKDPSPERRQAVAREYLGADGIRGQYLFGVRDTSRVDPDSWLVDKALIDRPGVDELMLDLLGDIHNNTPTFSAMQQFVRERRPQVLVATGVNDEIFPGEVQRNILKDLPSAEFHELDTGHFALEDKYDEIASLMRDFLTRVVPVRQNAYA
ncbi:alpha/beta fold hydrolase [Micromonospora sp. NPDC093277]|uniref:alpha/beta fold hydrolase n=1 Tax=Micromonospora sp. NPDC093277 TaxID=3364291 RepID=UPI00382C4559